MGGKIVFIIIIIVGLGLGLYLYNSGALAKGVGGFNTLFPMPTSSIGTASGTSASSSGGFSFWSFLAPPSSVAHITGPSLPPEEEEQTSASAPSSGTTTNVINPADIPAGFTAAQLSPYFHEVRFGGVSAGTGYYYGTITLNYDDYASPSTTIDITGWQIKSKASGEYIPQAIDVYDPSGLAAASDILLHNGDTVSMYSSSAPFNLRLNECIGYVAQIADFKPPLPNSCPAVNLSQIENFTGECQNYIESIGGCSQPNMSSPQIPRNDYACQDYLQNNFTYSSCFAAHDGDTNFLSNQIWVWTGSNVVDYYHDNVELLDRNGLLVDLYTY